MSKVLVTESYLTDIGNAIRSKNSSTDKYKPGEMAAAIKNIQGDILVVSPDEWTVQITQTDHQTITATPSGTVIKDGDKYKPAFTVNATISPNTGYVPGGILKSTDTTNHIYKITASAAEEIAGMVENGWGKVYEDGINFYSDENYTTKLSSLSGDILIAGIKNSDISSYSFSVSPLCDNKNLIKFKNTFITKTGNSLLESCKSLTLVDLSNLISVGDSLLSYCPSLKSVDLSNLTSAEGDLLRDCESLTSVDLPNLTSAGVCLLYGCTSLTSVNLPNLTSAGYYSFNGCESLTSVDLPNLTSAGSCLLGYCTSLTSVDLPKLTSVEDGFLSGCTKLQSIYLRSTTMCTLGGDTYLPSTVSIYVPASLIDSYKTADYWKKYANNFKTLESI